MKQDNSIKISDIINLKGGSIEGLVILASSVGVTIPNDPNYALTPSELKAIDPNLAFELKYSKKPQYHMSKRVRTDKNKAIKEKPSEVSKNKIIGIVKFYDGFKDFGFIVSNNKGLETESAGYKLDSYYFNDKCCSKNYANPKDGDLVIFSPHSNGTRQNANGVFKLEFTKENLLLVMPYRGNFAKIEGSDGHSSDVFNCNIINTIVKNIIKDKPKYDDVVSAFCEYVLSIELRENRQEIINEFLLNGELKNTLVSVFLSKQYVFGDSKISSIFQTWKNVLTDCIFETDSIDDLASLPQDIYLPMDKTTDILVKEARSKTIAVAEWLKRQAHIVEAITIDNKDSNTIHLRLILSELTNDASWISSLELEWNTFKDIVVQLEETQKTIILKQYLIGKDYDFVNEKLCEILSFKDFEKWASEFLEDNNSEYLTILRVCVYHLSKDNLLIVQRFLMAGNDISYILPQIQSLLSERIKENTKEVKDFLINCVSQKLEIETLFPIDSNISDELRAYLFVETNNYEYLNAMDDFDSCNKWVAKQESKFVVKFISQYGPLIEDDKENDAFIASLGKKSVSDALSTLDTDEQYQFLRFIPKSFASEIVNEFFSDSKLFDLYVGEQWTLLKSKIPYVAFDLETDGETIKEFAFWADGYTHSYEDEGQINTLIENINKKQIVVGHRIKQWDLNVLKKKGNIHPVFVWDTLEIEILLNPCRYAYSLHTSHNAKDDTELTDRLFWNQLLRLAQQKELCDQLSDFLPANIVSILDELQQPMFKELFLKTAESENPFFQELNDIDKATKERLETIGSEKNVLVIAPQRIWNRIAGYLEMSFSQYDNNIDYMTISEDLVRLKPLKDNYLQTLLLRFVKLSKTPIVSNIAKYIRLQYFDDKTLAQYVAPTNNRKAICADLRIDLNISDLSKYSKVYFIGCELENRLNQYTLPSHLRPSDFLAVNSSIPMRIGASSYTVVTSEDRKLSLFNDLPKDIANVWLERTKQGTYNVNYNYNIYSKLKNIVDSNKEKFEKIEWLSNSSDTKAITLLHSKLNRKFNYQEKRVSSTSRYRSAYWMYQMAMLRDIRVSMPIVYILEDNLEISEVEKYASIFGYYIPTSGTLVSRLEKIALFSNGLLIVSKDQFFDIVELRLDNPYCYVWDQMAVDKHLIMWKNIEQDLSHAILSDEINNGKGDLNIGSTQDTYQSTLKSMWPIYNYYSKFVLANNKSSKMYIIDPYLDDYHALSSVWECNSCTTSVLWSSENEYLSDLKKSKAFFSDFEISEIMTGGEETSKAMEVILETLITQKNGDKKEWTPTQKEVLPEILSKKENYLVSIPTGGGKSVLFQGPALYNSSFTNRLSLVVTPLKALMQDQVKELNEKGFYTNVDYLNGDKSYQEVRSIYRKINSGEIALLYVTPERFRSKAFINSLMTRIANDDGLEYIIFDEAHCIAQWGMEFRPEYLNVIKRCKELTEAYQHKVCLAMFSATVTDMIYNQINEQVPVKRLGQGIDKKSYNPIRSHIGISFQEVEHSFESRISAIVNYIVQNNIKFEHSRMLIFCKRKKECEELTVELPDLLKRAGIGVDENSVGYFHADLDSDERDEAYSRFKSDDDPIYILCATKAFGMGMDIPNIHYIVHLSPPNVLEDYLQEVGRAGRNKSMYEIAGFSESNPIPTLCLYSKEDIKKSREQLLSSMLSWKNLEEIRTEIIDYTKQIQSIGKTQTVPVVVPNNLWKSNIRDYSYTDFKIGEYWLERMGRIRMGYLSPAHINILINRNANIGSYDFTITELYKKLSAIAELQNSDTIQVSVQDLASDMSILPHKLIDSLVFGQKNGLLAINQRVRCRIPNTRIEEVPYMLKNSNIELTFHIILKATRALLENNRVNEERSYTDSEIKSLLRTDSLDKILKTIVVTDKNGKQTSKKYMPWFDGNPKNKKQGLVVATNYKKDLERKRLRHIFVTLLDIIPDVKCKSYIDRDKKLVKQSIIVEKATYKDYLPIFEEDCLKVLKYISSNNVKQTLDWAKAMNDIDLAISEFKHFESILRYLSCLAYISTDNILPTGIEVFATKNTEDVILEQLPTDSPDNEHKKSFDEAMRIRNLRLCIMDVLTNKVQNNKREFQELISAYFSKVDANGFIELLGKYYPDEDPIWGTIRETAIMEAEDKMRGNEEQWAIYGENSNTNVNVEAGPGSGKTHVLTMRCAKLIYRQHVQPSQILVLAYNRAVVVELKNRLAKLFVSLGLSRSASQLNIHTFHALAKIICGEKALEGLDMKEWEPLLLRTIQNYPQDVTKIFPDLRYVLIDEFQDITQVRLDSMLGLRKIYPQLAFFTIGDKDQSIYGFEKPENPDPQYYYDQLYKELGSKCMSMSTNYRSYPKILKEASIFLPPTSKVPRPCKAKIEEEPKEKYTFIFNQERKWNEDFESVISHLQKLDMSDVAVFFRTNSEVYHGYSILRTMNIPGIRLRIQGASECELFRKREIYTVIKYLENNSNKLISYNETLIDIKTKVENWIKSFANWDSFYLDFAFTLILDYLEFAEQDEDIHTYADMAKFIKETLSEDNPQLYKTYDKFEKERIIRDKQLNVILTTMHKVKGLEFDAVITTPSVSSLPFDPLNEVDALSQITEEEKGQIEEERRLLYVAFTRAKKFLIAYLGERENCVLNMAKYEGDDNSLGIREREQSLSNYNIGYSASDYTFNRMKINDFIVKNVNKNEPVSIQKTINSGFCFYNIVANGRIVGQLSSASNIRRYMDERNLSSLSGFFVSDVFYWTYQDSLLADERNDTNWAEKWCEDAKKKGHIFVVSISGYGK